MCTRSSKNKNQAWAYLGGFALVAVPGTVLLLSHGQQVANWELGALFLAEFSCGELMRSAYVICLKKRAQHELC